MMHSIRWLRAVVAFALLSAMACGSAKDTAPPSAPANAGAGETQVPQPALHPGDRWVDRIQGTDRDFRIDAVHGNTMDVSYWGIDEVTDPNLNIIVYRSLT